MGRSPACGKLPMKDEHWDEDKDHAKGYANTRNHGTGNWRGLSKKSEMGRYGKSCRIRRTDHLKASIRPESFTQQEEELIIKLHAAIGSRWSIIAQQLPGKSDNEVKNFWNTKLRKKLTVMGIDPVTHRPFSQILADYGNIGAFPKARTRFGSFNRNIKTTLISRSEKPPVLSEFEPGFCSNSSAANTFSRMEQSNDANNPSFHLLSQLQAIKLVTDASNYTHHEFMPPQMIADCASTSSSSSSSTNHAAVAKDFNWCDYLLEDAFPSGNFEDHDVLVNSPTDTKNLEETQNCLQGEEERNVEMNSFEASLPSSSSSFVEAILAREQEMHLDFQGLLEEPFYY